MRIVKPIGAAVVLVVIATTVIWVYFFHFTSRTDEIACVPGTLVIKSQEAILGAIGYRQQAQEHNKEWFFERMAVPAWKSLDVYNAGSITRTESQIRQLEKLGLSAVTRAWLETNGRLDASHGYTLVTLQIRDSEGIATELLELSKTSPYIRSILRQPGARIVREVDQVFDQKTTEKLLAKTHASATLTKARGTDTQLSFGAEQESTVTISDGSVVSYRLALLCWKADGTLQLRLDQGTRCPAGFSETLPDNVERVNLPTRPVVSKQHVVANPACPSIAGRWVRDLDGAKLLIEQHGCMITADAPTGPFSHSFRGGYADDYFQYVVKRTNSTDGCKTEMYGHIEVLSSDRIRIIVSATDGKCELASNFWEDLIWHREPHGDTGNGAAADTTERPLRVGTS
jgi:hypothetical protein